MTFSLQFNFAFAADGTIKIHDEWLHEQREGSMTVEAILETDFGALGIPLGFDDDRVVIDSVTFLMSFLHNANQGFIINEENRLYIGIVPYLVPIPAPGGEICKMHFHIADEVDYISTHLDTVPYDDGIAIRMLEGWDVNGIDLLELDFQPGYMVFEGPISYICGDFNMDYDVDLNDILDLMDYLFYSEEKGLPRHPGDSNCDYELDFLDLISLVNSLFRGGPEPCAFCE
jgi:hypothetical protein